MKINIIFLTTQMKIKNKSILNLVKKIADLKAESFIETLPFLYYETSVECNSRTK